MPELFESAEDRGVVGIEHQRLLVVLSSALPVASCGGNTPEVVHQRPPDFGVFRDGVRAWSFPSNAEKELFGSWQVPHNYAEGTELRPHLHWAVNTTTATGNVVWKLEWTVAATQ